MSDIYAGSADGDVSNTHFPPPPPPRAGPTIVHVEPRRGKRKTKKMKPKKIGLFGSSKTRRVVPNAGKGRHQSDSDSDSDTSTTQSSNSTASTSSTFSYIVGDPSRYGENRRDQIYRKNEHKKIRKRGRGRKHKVEKARSRSTSSGSSDSGLDHIEQFEKTFVTSKAVRSLWKAVQDLQERVASVENESDGEEEKRKQQKNRAKGKPIKEKSPVDVTIEVEKVRDDAVSEDAKDGNAASISELVKKEEDDGNQTNSQKDGPEAPKVQETEPELVAHDDDDSDWETGDSDNSNDHADDGEKPYAQRPFELKTQFFYRADEEQHRIFHSPDIFPLIRVRWDDLFTRDGVKSTLVNTDKKGKVIPGQISIIEICIESPPLIEFFNSYLDFPRNRHGGYSGINNTISFYKPFRWLIHNREKFQKTIERFEDTNRENDNQLDIKPLSGTNENLDSINKDEGIPRPNQSLKFNLYEHLKVLISFMDEHLAKPIETYEQYRTGNLKSIKFENLWMLYRPGDIVYTDQRQPVPAPATSQGPQPPHGPPGMRSAGQGPNIPRQGFGRLTPQAYKIASVVGGRTYVHPDPRGRKASIYSELKILCYFIDFNGSRFDCVADTFTFRPFDNEISVTDLEAYPLAYASFGDAQGESSMLKFLENRGKSFIEVTEASHKLYEGLAYSTTKEEINTPVIIDFALAYQNLSSLKPQFSLPTVDFFNQPVRHGRTEVFEVISRVQNGRSYDWYWPHQTELINRERFMLMAALDSYPTVGAASLEPAIPNLISAMRANGHILLLPGMVHGFALRNRKWVSLELTSLQDAQYEDGWKDLILPSGHKEMVRAVVENHATGSRSTAGMTKGAAEVDIVRGKGKGCIILLHGEPGVGKTSTAECVAAFTKRPLFPITCGDIGYEPDEVERNLEKHFNLAHKWGCVMLLDEADVFLAKRSREDIKRNGLVSVFLRILEYYPGILFLTTNRVGAFDDAFRSRLHLTLYYPKLDRKQTIQIFEMNLRRMAELNSKRNDMGQKSIEIQPEKIIKFAKKHWETLSWNGRQIRNAFQTALALAEFDVRDEEEKQPTMSNKQFKTIAKASMEFDDYLFHTHGGTDQSTIARKEQTRWDYEIKGRPDKKPDLGDSSSDTSSESSSSSSDSSEASEASDNDSSSSDSEDAKRRKRKKGKGRDKEKKSKKSDSKSKRSKAKKDKHA